MVNGAPHDMPASAERDVPAPRVSSTRRRWMTLMLVTATAVSGVAGLLSHAAGNNVPGAVLTAGAAFAGAFGLLLAVAHYAEAGTG
jgi:hypothetical protein